jgi:hypothetical protein
MKCFSTRRASSALRILCRMTAITMIASSVFDRNSSASHVEAVVSHKPATKTQQRLNTDCICACSTHHSGHRLKCVLKHNTQVYSTGTLHHTTETTSNIDPRHSTALYLFVHELRLLYAHSGGLDGVDDQCERMGRLLGALEHLPTLRKAVEVKGKKQSQHWYNPELVIYVGSININASTSEDNCNGYIHFECSCYAACQQLRATYNPEQNARASKSHRTQQHKPSINNAAYYLAVRDGLKQARILCTAKSLRCADTDKSNLGRDVS